jgi:hypothetical protein
VGSASHLATEKSYTCTGPDSPWRTWVVRPIWPVGPRAPRRGGRPLLNSASTPADSEASRFHPPGGDTTTTRFLLSRREEGRGKGRGCSLRPICYALTRLRGPSQSQVPALALSNSLFHILDLSNPEGVDCFDSLWIGALRNRFLVTRESLVGLGKMWGRVSAPEQADSLPFIWRPTSAAGFVVDPWRPGLGK